MQHQPEHIAPLILKVLQGTITEAEQAVLDSWCNQSEENRALLNDMIQQEGWFDHLSAYYQACPPEMVENAIAQKKARPRAFTQSIFYRAAAALLAITIGIAIYYYYMNTNHTSSYISIKPETMEARPDTMDFLRKKHPVLTLADGTYFLLDSMSQQATGSMPSYTVRLDTGIIQQMIRKQSRLEGVAYHTLSTPSGVTCTAYLPDGSQLTLNAASSIEIKTGYHIQKREITLTGEAYFDIKHLDSREGPMPFTVLCAGTKIAVLGTRFNIKQSNDHLYATLLSGSINIWTDSSSQTLNQPGLQATVNSDKHITLSQVDPMVQTAWYNHYIRFRSRPLKEILEVVAQWHPVTVAYTGETIADKKFTIALEYKDNIEELLKPLLLTGGVKINFEKGRITVHE